MDDSSQRKMEGCLFRVISNATVTEGIEKMLEEFDTEECELRLQDHFMPFHFTSHLMTPQQTC